MILPPGSYVTRGCARARAARNTASPKKTLNIYTSRSQVPMKPEPRPLPAD